MPDDSTALVLAAPASIALTSAGPRSGRRLTRAVACAVSIPAFLASAGSNVLLSRSMPMTGAVAGAAAS